MAVLGINCFLLLTLSAALSFGSPTSCDEVRKVFQLRQIGPGQLLPTSPRTASDLQVCASKNQTCCTKKMEERYQLVARQDLHNLLQSSSSSLRVLLLRGVAAFQETFEVLLKQAENQTNVLLRESYHSIVAQAAGPLRELFTDTGLFLLGSELSVEDSVQRFFDALFPLVYSHLINTESLSDIAPGYAECVRSSRRQLRPFGAAPGILANQLARSGISGKLLLQALHLGIEVINTTDHLQFSRECRRALLKMHFCPHCQALTQTRPCVGYCLNVMRGCLANMADIDAHWREFVRSLEGLSERMQGPQDLEQVLMGVHTLLHNAVAHAQKNRPRLSAQIQRLCGAPIRTSGQFISTRESLSAQSVPLKGPLRERGDSLKGPLRERGDSLALKRTEFLTSLRLRRAYYGGLADQLCVRELASGDSPSCWNGADVVTSYTMRVVGNGIKAQSANPEVKVKGPDLVINQIIDKLKHINQLLQGKSIPKLGTLDQIETGSGGLEERSGGDCDDDEDGCAGSGGGGTKRNAPRIAKLGPDRDGDRRREPHPEREDTGPGGGAGSRDRRIWAAWALILTCFHILLDF